MALLKNNLIYLRTNIFNIDILIIDTLVFIESLIYYIQTDILKYFIKNEKKNGGKLSLIVLTLFNDVRKKY